MFSIEIQETSDRSGVGNAEANFRFIRKIWSEIYGGRGARKFGRRR